MDATLQSLLNIVKSCDSLQLCTFGLGEYPETRHVMNGMNTDAGDLNLHFLTTVGSPKYEQIRENPHVCLYYYNETNHHACRLFGLIEIVSGNAAREKYWRDDYKRFGYTGASDPKYALLRFIPKQYKFYIGHELHTGDIN